MDMRKMMREAQKMQKEMEKASEEIALLRAEGRAGGGMVRAVARGDGLIVSVHIEPDVVDPADVEILQDMVMTAVNDAINTVSDLASQRMNVVTGGLNVPGL